MEVAWGVWGDEGEGVVVVVVVVVVEGIDEVDGVEGGVDLEEEGSIELLAVHAARGGAVLYVALMTRKREAYRTCALWEPRHKRQM